MAAQAQVAPGTSPKKKTMEIGSTADVSFRISNPSGEKWPAGSYELAPVRHDSANRTRPVARWVKERPPVPRLGPGASETVRVEITAPGRAGEYEYRWQVKKKGGWRIGMASEGGITIAVMPKDDKKPKPPPQTKGSKKPG